MSRVTNKPYYVYVLWSDTGQRFYIGISDSPADRLAQHNNGIQRAWTSRYRPWRIVHSEVFPTYSDARRREIELKSMKGGAGFFSKTGLDPAHFPRGS